MRPLSSSENNELDVLVFRKEGTILMATSMAIECADETSPKNTDTTARSNSDTTPRSKTEPSTVSTCARVCSCLSVSRRPLSGKVSFHP